MSEIIIDEKVCTQRTEKSKEFDNMPVNIDIVRHVLKIQLSDAYYCTRVWSAWGYGTMAEDDFEQIDVEQLIQCILDEKRGQGIDV